MGWSEVWNGMEEFVTQRRGRLGGVGSLLQGMISRYGW